MKFNIQFLTLLVHCNSLIGAPNALHKPEGKLIGGHNSEPSKHPYLVSLQMRFFIVRSHICGGTLLNENWILTAAHCVTTSFLIRWLPMDAVAGAMDVHNPQSTSYGPGAQIATIDRRIAHPDYDNNIGPNDIAVLHTSSPFSFTTYVQPARLPIPEDRLTYDRPLKLVGWGILRTTIFFPDLPKALQEVNVTYLNYNDCYEAVEGIKDPGEVNPLDKESNICTGPIKGGVAACSGDSGGPLIQTTPKLKDFELIDENDIDDVYPLSLPHNKEEGREIEKKEDNEIVPVVVGVVSWGGSPCGTKGAPTVYTKVENFINFINTYVQ